MKMLYHLRKVLVIMILVTASLTGRKTMLAQQGSVATYASQPQFVVQTGSDIRWPAFSPDGRYLVTCGAIGRLWDVSTGLQLGRFEGRSSAFTSAAFSPDGRLIVTGSSEKIARLWDVRTSKEIRQFIGHSGYVGTVSFSPDGHFIATGSEDKTARLWNAETGKEVQRFETKEGIHSVSFSPDSRFILTGGGNSTEFKGGIARLWEITSGKEVQDFTGHTDIASVAFSPDGRSIVTGGGWMSDKQSGVWFWSIETGKVIRRFGQRPISQQSPPETITSVAFSPDGRFILGGGNLTSALWEATSGKELWRVENSTEGGLSAIFSPDGRFVLSGNRLLDLATSKEIRRFDGYSTGVSSATFSPNGQIIVAGNGGSFSKAKEGIVQFWDVAEGKEVRRFRGHSSNVQSVAFSPDNRFVLTGSGYGFDIEDNTARLWDTSTGKEVKRFEGHSTAINAVAFSPDGRFILTGGTDNARLWDAKAGNEVWRFEGHPLKNNELHYCLISSVAFSPDSRFALTGSWDKTARLWNVKTGKEVLRYVGHTGYVTSVAFSPNGRFVLTGSGNTGDDYTVRLWNATTGKEIRQFIGHSHNIHSVAFSPDGQFVLTGSLDQTCRLWNAATGKLVHRFEGYSSYVESVAFSPDGRIALTAGDDNSTWLWDVLTGKELCRLISFHNDDWAVVTPEGRFDTNNIENIRGAHWIMPDDPFKPISLVTFARDYYESRLLPRILAGEKFKPIRNISELNRVFPNVKIAEIAPDSLGTVKVTIEVSKAKGEFLQGAGKVVKETGVYDVRLFRDGQLVGYAPKTKGEIGEIKVDDNTGKAMLTFSNIKLPRKQDITQVEFSAYAFNVDRLKSATDHKIYELPKNLTPIKGRAYLVTVGVNANEQPNLALRFAANDARGIQSALSERLGQRGEYAEIVQVSLISDYVEQAGDKKTIENRATKGNIKAVLDLLAGRKVAPEVLKDIPNADKLRQARPEDLLLIAFSSHGYADANGEFYVVPYDTGQAQILSADFLQRCVSSQELSLWLRDVDAGEMTMIVDACHSSSAVEGKDFKPAPMGSRGLGQLSYDKGMRILTATQADNVALGSGKLEQGLLTYALVHDGFEEGAADFKPRDNKITLSEWLAYGVERVPKLYEQIKSGELREVVHGNAGKAGQTLKVQYPGLFDFARKGRDVVLVKKE